MAKLGMIRILWQRDGLAKYRSIARVAGGGEKQRRAALSGRTSAPRVRTAGGNARRSGWAGLEQGGVTLTDTIRVEVDGNQGPPRRRYRNLDIRWKSVPERPIRVFDRGWRGICPARPRRARLVPGAGVEGLAADSRIVAPGEQSGILPPWGRRPFRPPGDGRRVRRPARRSSPQRQRKGATDRIGFDGQPEQPGKPFRSVAPALPQVKMFFPLGQGFRHAFLIGSATALAMVPGPGASFPTGHAGPRSGHGHGQCCSRCSWAPGSGQTLAQGIVRAA